MLLYLKQRLKLEMRRNRAKIASYLNCTACGMYNACLRLAYKQDLTKPTDVRSLFSLSNQAVRKNDIGFAVSMVCEHAWCGDLFAYHLVSLYNRQQSTSSCSTAVCLVPARGTRRTTKPPPWWIKKEAGYVVDNITEANQKFLRDISLDIYSENLKERKSSNSTFERGVWETGSVRTGLVCRKIGVIPQYFKNGTRVLCTLLEAKEKVLDNHVISYTDPEKWYKYSKIGKKEGLKMLGRLTVGVQSDDPQKFTAAYRGIFEKAGVLPKQKLAGFAITPNAQIQPGTRLYANHFTVGQYVDVWGHTIDYGFQGVMVRWGFKGMPATHGVTKTHRRPGSIGTAGQACVKPGKKMPGHMGSEWRALRGIQILRINTAEQVLYVKGPNVPGPVGALIYVKDSGVMEKRVSVRIVLCNGNPPFPTFYPEECDPLPEEQFHDSLFQYTEPTIEYPEEKATSTTVRKGPVKVKISENQKENVINFPFETSHQRMLKIQSRCALSTVKQIGQFVKRWKSSLVLVEHDNEKISTASLSAITAASKLGDVSCLILGDKCQEVANSVAKVNNVKNVYVTEHSALRGFLPEIMTPLIIACQSSFKFDVIIAAATGFGKNIIPRVAAKLDVSCCSDVIEIKQPDVFVRPLYAGNALATIKVLDAVKVMTVRPTTFPPAGMNSGNATVRQGPVLEAETAVSEFIGQELSKSERPQLTEAKVVVSGGRGMKSAENFKLLYDLADRLGAAVGASRAAVDAGYVHNDFQVGQTGKIVAPDLYIALGISGAIQHLAGIKDSRTIVAINTDADAPIFKVADYGLIADLFEAVPEMIAILDKS
ncbi:Electron transfer flavoprotein subunit alpha, mitochondrial [Trichinella murrelli]|uniref:Electron transfer flavoprotein subunit alpha, mitochondrial n=1 Tax=Trichinella murrelli TaxID=144512 RepID=A0A0V0U1R8_9BILA|nr:Electron transfer flavoprotein subunit alpha, mitochondrial [Trichinella murrelli]